MTLRCPNCGFNNTRLEYGGERGEAGPFIVCNDCDYDEEAALGARRIKAAIHRETKALRLANARGATRAQIDGVTWIRQDATSIEAQFLAQCSHVADLTGQIDCLNAEIDTLRAALKPFASIKPSDTAPYAYWVVIGTPYQCSFTHKDLIFARKVAGVEESD